jgi:hypothetical protein
MADEDENLIVDLNADDEELTSIPGATPVPRPGVVVTKPPPVPGPSTAPRIGMEELQRQIEAERTQRAHAVETSRRLAAERDNAVRYAQESERRGVQTYEAYNNEQIKATGDQIEALSAQHESAMTDGDFKTAAALTRKISHLSGQLALLERDAGALAQQREQLARPQPQRQQQQPQPQQQPVTVDPVERAGQGRSERTKEFLRRHRSLVRSDGSLKRAAIDAHEAALDAGYAAESDGYFTHIEGLLGNGQAGGEPMPQGRQPAPMQAAPVSRSGGPGSSGGGSGPREFVMTPKMRRLAADAGVTPKEWALNYERLLKEGRITPIA